MTTKTKTQPKNRFNHIVREEPTTRPGAKQGPKVKPKYDLIEDYHSLFLTRQEMLIDNITGFKGMDIYNTRDLLDGDQLAKVQEIRDRKLGRAELLDYRPL